MPPVRSPIGQRNHIEIGQPAIAKPAVNGAIDRYRRHRGRGSIGVDERLERSGTTAKRESVEDERKTVGVEQRGLVNELEVKVRPARVPRVAELAEHLPLPHPVAAMDADAARNEVRVAGEHPLAE